MQTLDYFVIVLYVLGIVTAGIVFTGKMKSSKDMFAAGGQSPWWVSGLSAFMTMFSAGTFVVWGGIAYKYGVVAIVINLCYGVSALLVGLFLAGVWRKAGVNSASEFLQLRYGGSIVQFYAWVKGTLTLFSTGGAVYALSKIVCALMPLPEGHLLVDPATGHLSVTMTSITLSLIVIVITFSGGLWAVLMTDVLQFVILTVSVVFVVPLILSEVGGWGSFVAAAPEGFLLPVAADFSWWYSDGYVCRRQKMPRKRLTLLPPCILSAPFSGCFHPFFFE
jgi:solute:Na+ symporter, SSS family